MIEKKALLRVIEATIAIMIIFSALLILVAQKQDIERAGLEKIPKPILDEIAKDNVLRKAIINYDISKDRTDTSDNGNGYTNAQIIEDVEIAVVERIPQNAEFRVSICNPEVICILEDYPDNDVEVFSSDRIISAVLDEGVFSPKKLKLFVWIK